MIDWLDCRRPVVSELFGWLMTHQQWNPRPWILNTGPLEPGAWILESEAWTLGPWTRNPGASDPWTLGPWTLGPGPLDPGPSDPRPSDPGPLTLDPWTLDPWTLDPWTLDPWTEVLSLTKPQGTKSIGLVPKMEPLLLQLQPYLLLREAPGTLETPEIKI